MGCAAVTEFYGSEAGGLWNDVVWMESVPFIERWVALSGAAGVEGRESV